jgi:hypothetical protein
MKYTVNRTLLKQWLKDEKSKSEFSSEVESELIKQVGISSTTLKSLLYSEGYQVGLQTRILLAQYTKLKPEQLFNAVGVKEAA